MKISVKEHENHVRISVQDTGIGIPEEVITNLYQEQVPAQQIGLYNVHQRVKLMYGEGLAIRRLSPGTEIYFDIPKENS
ncbi:Sensor histidine kinase YpdA [compost metagenome]